MLKIIIGFIALLILLAASYIIFVDNNQNTNENKEHFQMPQNEQEKIREMCQNFKNNPRNFIEDNSNFTNFHQEPTDINDRMKNRYNFTYNQCYLSNQNTQDPDNCNNIDIGTIPTNFTGEFGQKMINCISNDSCDVLKTSNECVRKGDDCPNFEGEAQCNRVNHCLYYDDVCQSRLNLCYRHEDQESCNADNYCNYTSSDQCLEKDCYDNNDSESCEANPTCLWNGSFCSTDYSMNCRETPSNECASHSACVLTPIERPRALCVQKSN